MSQEKVDQKKYDRTHRKSLVRKKKIEEFLSITCVAVITIAIVAWVGFSIYTKVEANNEENAETSVVYNEIDNSAIQNYLSTLYE